MASTRLHCTEADSLHAPLVETETEAVQGRTLPTAPPLEHYQPGIQAPNMAAPLNEMLLTDDEQQGIRNAGLGEGGINFLNRQLRARTTHRRNHWSTNSTSCSLPQDTIRVLLCGMGGVGKSALGNLLTKGTNFSVSNKAKSETQAVCSASADYDGRTIVVYDTPGYLLRKLLKGEENPTKLIKNGIGTIEKGIHVFILVCNASDARERPAEIQLIQKAKLLNQGTFCHAMVVGTHSAGHYSGKGAVDFIQAAESAPEFNTFIENIARRVVLVELGDGEQLTSSKLESGEAYFDKEKEDGRKMIMDMIANVMVGNSSKGTLYPIEQLKSDLKPCFPPQATVYTPQGKKTMEDLEISDEVLVVKTEREVQYEKIIMFSHANPSHTSYFCTISTEDGKVLQLSPGHLLHVGKIGTLAPAQDVKLGDEIFTHDGDCAESVRSVRVSAISGEWLTGIYCPHTPSGSIIVDGVSASCYTNLLSPTLAHVAMFPVRVAHRVLPDDWFRWLMPYNSEQGMPSLVWRLSQII